MEDNKRKLNDAHTIPIDKRNFVADHLDLDDRISIHNTETDNDDNERG